MLYCRRLISVFIYTDTLKSRRDLFVSGNVQNTVLCYIKENYAKTFCSISITINKFNSQLNHVLSYPFMRRHRTYSSMYWVLSTVGTIQLFVIEDDNRQKLISKIYQEESNHHEKLSPSINHEYTVQIDGVVKISVNKVNGLNIFFAANIFRQYLQI